MAIDAKQWLLEQGFTEAEATEMAPRFTPERLAPIEAGYLRQADYSSKLNEMQTAQAALESANTRLNAEMAEWATLQASGQELTKKQQQALEKSQAQAAMLRTRVENLATQAGIDPKVALEGIETVVVPQNTPPPNANALDPSKFVSTEAFNRQYAQLTNLMVTLPGEMFNLATEHQQLYGKPLDAAAVSKEILTRATTPNNQKSLEPRQVWEEMHSVPAQREKIATEKYNADIKAAEERGREAARSEQIPGAPPAPGQRAPIFQQARKSALERPQPGTTVNAAAAAFRSGKYRTPEKSTA